MTLVDAVRTGRRFKRPKWDLWYSFENNNSDECVFTKEEIEATDWIIEEPKPKRRLYIDDAGFMYATDEPMTDWKPLSKAELEELFE